MEQAEGSEHKRVVALAIDASEHAEKALECKLSYFIALAFIGDAIQESMRIINLSTFCSIVLP